MRVSFGLKASHPEHLYMRSPLSGLTLLMLWAVVVSGGGCSCNKLTPPAVPDEGGGDVLFPDDGDGDGSGNSGGPLLPQCGTSVCSAGEVCRFEACLSPPKACHSDFDCENDTYCVEGDAGGECIPYGLGPRGASGFNPECRRLDALGVFQPSVACEWRGDASHPSHVNVSSTPLVADFKLEPFSVRARPSIVFVANNYASQEPGKFGLIYVIDGETCETQAVIGSSSEALRMNQFVTPAIADMDLDADGRPEIVVHRQLGGVLIYKYHPAPGGGVGTFEPMNVSELETVNALPEGTSVEHWDSLALHDVDNDGIPEIIQTSPTPVAYDNRGRVKYTAAAGIQAEYLHQLHPVVARLDDGTVVLSTGQHVLKFDSASMKIIRHSDTGNDNSLGFTAFADFGTFTEDGLLRDRAHLDGIPEVVVVSKKNSRPSVRVQTLLGNVLYQYDFPTDPKAIYDFGGAPTVADVDGDGFPEIGVAGGYFYAVVDPDCVTGASAARCSSGAADGILWKKRSQDLTSTVTGSSVFDFEGDGKSEIVYADECFSRVYDGQTGEVLFSQHHTSCTWYENPVVADTGNDFHSKIIIPSNQCSISCPSIDPIHPGIRCERNQDCPSDDCWKANPQDAVGLCRCVDDGQCGSSSMRCAAPLASAPSDVKVCRAYHPAGTSQNGILVMQDRNNAWVPSRHIWNQHAYSITHVDDAGEVPRTSEWKQNWKEPHLNNFRLNRQGGTDFSTLADLTVHRAGTVTCGPNGKVTLASRICNRGIAAVPPEQPVTFRLEGANGPWVCPPASTGPEALQPGECREVSCTPNVSLPSQAVITVVAEQPSIPECNRSNNLGTLVVSCEV
jgi:hypothetical protein